MRTDDGWLAAYVSARKFFRFHPVVAVRPDPRRPDAARRRRRPQGDRGRRRCIASSDEWRLLASDGVRRRYPVFDLDLTEVGSLDAPYDTNIPWPTILDLGDDGQLMIGFDGEPTGGRLVGYGSHGAVRFARADASHVTPSRP